MEKEKAISTDYTFTLGVVRYNDLLYFALQDDRVDIAQEPHFNPVTLDGNQWGGNQIIPWTPVGMTVCQAPIEQMITISETGDVYCLGSGHESSEIITHNGSSPLERGGPLRHVRAIEGYAYAVGMKRQVYKRTAANHWMAIDAGVYSDDDKVVGFESIDGFSMQDIYTVGWEGEIWKFDGAKWDFIDSPTNLILTDVCCAGSGEVYVSGQMGTLIVGRDHTWSLIETDIEENIWSLAWFNNSLYMATFSGIYVLKNGQILRVDFNKEKPGTFYHLHTNDGMMISVGGKDVMGFDGTNWTRIH